MDAYWQMQQRTIRRELQALALRLRDHGLLPNDVPPRTSDWLLDLLCYGALLLDQAADRRAEQVGVARLKGPGPTEAPEPTMSEPGPKASCEVEGAEPGAYVAGPLTTADSAVQTNPFGEEPAKISATAARLIELRDWVLPASGDGAASPLADGLYWELGKVLEKEGVTTLEADGPYDDEQQRVVQAEVTTDPAQHDHICATVRPGYAFAGRLLRPQEVTVFAYRGDADVARDEEMGVPKP